jgi:membrane-bound inhibitor of C-type lysozyme
MAENPPEEESRGAVVDWITNTFDPWLESRRASNTLAIFLILLAAIPIIGLGIIATRYVVPLQPIQTVQQAVQQIPQQIVNGISAPFGGDRAAHTTFVCAGGSSVEAFFDTGSVELALSDGRTLTLPEVNAVVGSRYANSDESFVFSVEGDLATVREHNTVTYKNCIAS